MKQNTSQIRNRISSYFRRSDYELTLVFFLLQVMCFLYFIYSLQCNQNHNGKMNQERMKK